MQNVILVFQELFTYCLCSLLKNARLRMDAKTVTVVIQELQVCFCIQKVESWCTMLCLCFRSCLALCQGLMKWSRMLSSSCPVSTLMQGRYQSCKEISTGMCN